MTEKTLFDFLISEAERPFSGWDFSYISKTGRMAESPLDWSYTSLILPELRRADSMLDMGTGGGEFLSMFLPFPANTYATEAYKPNVPIAKKRLEPLGVNVSEISDDEELPYEDETFDLIINRHEAYSVSELKRILKCGGMFITQQVGGKNDISINALLEAPINGEFSHWDLAYAVNEMKEAGFEILKAQEQFPNTRYYDIGALVYYLKAIPWQVTDFTIDRYFNRLKSIHELIEKDGYLDIPSHRFLIIAKK
ncbi:class I SAM-dependent methyltransferase [Pseudalkalibacillus caeni]|uniref:Class I SAM-dependent methyltransferase n=1 Tax=Exobacillus caeni TaxID=2574798 RepID=A0A5R9F6P0_9BACL|nr:class I SAM-dependent methyltransferase [Pseudalkalibacillus caeni]TLS38169.1 class I SAM-dependent methyltransferase [Pseudalkalibacillus caeni]